LFRGHPNRERFTEIFTVSSKHRYKPKNSFLDIAKQIEKQPKQIEFWFILDQTEKKFECFEDTLNMMSQGKSLQGKNIEKN
jgi:hypothetical protein